MDTSHPGIAFLVEHAGPIIRYRMARDWGVHGGESRDGLLRRVLETDEVARWLGNLGGRDAHGSKDTCAENGLAKLIEYGLDASVPAFDARARPYLEMLRPSPWDIPSDTLGPFLIAAGYGQLPAVRTWFLERLAVLARTAEDGDYDIYAPEQKARRVPKAWRGRRIYKPAYWTGERRLPSIYDLYALAYWAPESASQATAVERVIAFLADPRYQATPGGYLWNTDRNTCYAAGRAWLACLDPQRTVLFLTLAARFPICHGQPWFRETLRNLVAFRTDRGTTIWPSDFLTEKRNSYYTYGGGHMGLGENRRRRIWREIESTFRMLEIERLMQTGPAAAISS